ncbi:hypothetical protein CC85DRAFT_322214 [Cutaneotrichosporon oleaginosum]|uniref:Uncharacterized protein n=1 Tax=Cutaneotrichosporon oleaginosum TaxID=879819 RepID=A0A0J0XGF1_9TREE|nr:uncharacterized protein CC85DRAFT_322214 [Cutaneotrichosporon oleaginosum]KLT40102.1 hypothetical protein CC85DRAFT_322214 [Cutaneotrichosporon oleaginosum]TXT04741.1 hypothetical protein COLE_07560 [Cutaneotrichosporon oleaginosum]
MTTTAGRNWICTRKINAHTSEPASGGCKGVPALRDGRGGWAEWSGVESRKGATGGAKDLSRLGEAQDWGLESGGARSESCYQQDRYTDETIVIVTIRPTTTTEHRLHVLTMWHPPSDNYASRSQDTPQFITVIDFKSTGWWSGIRCTDTFVLNHSLASAFPNGTGPDSYVDNQIEIERSGGAACWTREGIKWGDHLFCIGSRNTNTTQQHDVLYSYDSALFLPSPNVPMATSSASAPSRPVLSQKLQTMFDEAVCEDDGLLFPEYMSSFPRAEWTGSSLPGPFFEPTGEEDRKVVYAARKCSKKWSQALDTGELGDLSLGDFALAVFDKVDQFHLRADRSDTGLVYVTPEVWLETINLLIDYALSLCFYILEDAFPDSPLVDACDDPDTIVPFVYSAMALQWEWDFDSWGEDPPKADPYNTAFVDKYIPDPASLPPCPSTKANLLNPDAPPHIIWRRWDGEEVPWPKDVAIHFRGDPESYTEAQCNAKFHNACDPVSSCSPLHSSPSITSSVGETSASPSTDRPPPPANTPIKPRYEL